MELHPFITCFTINQLVDIYQITFQIKNCINDKLIVTLLRMTCCVLHWLWCLSISRLALPPPVRLPFPQHIYLLLFRLFSLVLLYDIRPSNHSEQHPCFVAWCIQRHRLYIYCMGDSLHPLRSFYQQLLKRLLLLTLLTQISPASKRAMVYIHKLIISLICPLTQKHIFKFFSGEKYLSELFECIFQHLDKYQEDVISSKMAENIKWHWNLKITNKEFSDAWKSMQTNYDKQIMKLSKKNSPRQVRLD